jgi:hypothetical protein
LASVLALPGSRAVIIAAGSLSMTGCSCTGASIMPETLPVGQVGHPYFFQLSIEFSGSGCTGGGFTEIGPGQGGLPPGMKVSRGGALDGTPQAAGTYRFQVDVIYGDYGSSGASRIYDLTILPP